MTKSEVILEMNLKESQKLNLPFNPKKEDFDKFSEIFEKRKNKPKTQNIGKLETEKNSEKKPQKKPEKKSKKQKKFPEIPIVSHESEKPKKIYEEINNGKLKATIYDYSCISIDVKDEKETDEKTLNKNSNDDKKEKLKNKSQNKEKQKKNEKNNSAVEKKNDKNKDNDSATVSTTVTEQNEVANKNDKKLRNKGKKNKKDNSNNNKNNEKKSEIKNDKKSDKTYENIPIIAHNSEKPSMVFEESYSGKLYASLHDFGNDNNKECEKNLKNGPKKCENKNKVCSKKFMDIPVVKHDSQKPSIIYEEVNNGKI